MKTALQLNEINFDDVQQVEAIAKEKVEIEVGALHFLLTYFSLCGGEPKKNNARLNIALDNTTIF